MDVPRMDRSLGDLFSDLSQQTAELIRQEIRLAKTELSDKVADVGKNAMLIGAGVAFALAAVVSLALAVTLILIALGVVPWLAAVIATVAMGVTAFVLAQSGISALKNQSIAPVETMHSLKETTQWLKNGTR